MPTIHFGQAPDLGVASGFALFTSAGAVNVLGASTVVTGDVGTNVGAFTGFPPGTIFGQIHIADAVTAQAAIDVPVAFSYLQTRTCGVVSGTTLGNGQILAPNIYCLGAASTLNGDLTLDGQNDPDAIFIFQIDGAMATSTLSNVFLINSASLCNVYWQINGEFTLGEGSVFRGTVVNNGAVHLLEGSSLFGRVLSTAGAIDLHNNIVTMQMQPTPSVITAGSATTFCEGGQVVLSGNVGGAWNTGSSAESITVAANGDYFVTNTNGCGSNSSNHILVTVNPLPVASVISANGPIAFCEGDNVILSGNTGGTWNIGSSAESITVTTDGDYFATNTNNCGSINSNHILTTTTPLPVASVIAPDGATTFCEGGQVVLSGNNGGTWSTGATTASITVITAGDYFVTNTNACGSISSNHLLVAVYPKPILIAHTDAVCSPNRIDLTAPGVTDGSTLFGATLSYWMDANATIPLSNPKIAGNGTYYIMATTPQGCYDIEPVTVVINRLPTVFTATGSGSYCEGGPGLEVGLSGSQTGVVYTLQVCERCPVLGMAPGAGGPISFGYQKIAGLYSVFAEDTITHCTNWMYNCIEITIDPVLPVSVSIAPSANPVAAGTAVTYIATPLNGGTTPVFQWKLNGLDAGTNNHTFAYVPGNGDEVKVVLISSETCVSGNPDTSNIVLMEVLGVPTTTSATGIILNGQDRCYNARQTLTIAGNGSTFTVFDGASATMISGQNILYLPGTTVLPGGYMKGYITTDGRYCGQKSPSIATVAMGSDEIPAFSQATSFRLYPNPTTGNFTIEQNGEKVLNNVKVEVYGVCGERIMSKEMTGDMQHEFMISDSRYGLYFVKIVADQYAQTFKVVKTK